MGYGQDNGGASPNDLITIGRGQDAYQIPADQQYLLGTSGRGQEMTPVMGNQAAFAAQNPDDWYLDSQARATPEGQSAFKSAFDKGPADPKSWFDWANHINKFYGAGGVKQLSENGFFKQFNMSADESDQLGKFVASKQQNANDPLFGNSGLTIPQVIMMIGGAAVGGAGAWAGGGAGAVGGDVALAGGEGSLAGSSIDTSGFGSDFDSPAFKGSSISTAGFGSDFDTGPMGGDGPNPASSLNSSGFGSDFDISSFADPNFGAFPNPTGGPIDPSGFGSSFDSPGMPMEVEGGGFDDWWKKFKGLPWRPAGAALNFGSGLYGLQQAKQMQKLAQQAQDPNTAQYRDQLAQLMRDPSSVKNIPGYQFGLDEGRLAIERRGAASGSGGNEAIALARYTPEYAGKFYDMEARRLANLAQGNPGAQIQGQAAAAQLRSQALASLGYSAFAMGSSKFPW